MKARQRKRIIILGNCVAERLQRLLLSYPGFADRYILVPSPMVHTLHDEVRWEILARQALACDLILTQPLFSFGPCNTEALRAALKPCRDLLLFSAPDFEAYFPDALTLRDRNVNQRLQPVLDWDSRIVFSCFVHKVSIFEVEEVYLNHSLFGPQTVRRAVASALEAYARREQGLDIGTLEYFIRNYGDRKLFHSPRHPVDEFLLVMLRGLAEALGLDPEAAPRSVDGFGFNQWPIITRHQERFAFAEQAYFILAGRRCALEDVAMAYYNFYEFHPHVVEANLDKVVAV